MNREFRSIVRISVVMFIVLLASFVGYLFSPVNAAGFIVVCAGTLALSLRRLSLGALIVLGELFLGSQGLLFTLSIGTLTVSLRLMLFLVVFGVWALRTVQRRQLTILETPYVLPFATLVVVIGIGFIRGAILNSPTVAFFDANGYFFLGFLPVFIDAFASEADRARIRQVLVAGVVTLTMATLGLFWAFGYWYYSPDLVQATRISEEQLRRLDELATLPENARLAQTTLIAREKLQLQTKDVLAQQPVLYRYAQDRGIAQVAYIGGRFFRVFMASHLFVLLAFLWLLAAWFWGRFSIGRQLILLGGLGFTGSVLLISFSRSLWLGGAAGALILWFCAPRRRKIISLALAVILAIVVVLIVAMTQPALREVISDRVASFGRPATELAAANRLSLLGPLWAKILDHPIIGHGFGELVVYRTLIPGTDLVEYVSVYLTEWAYFDLALKLGGIGIAAYAWFAVTLIREGVRRLRERTNDERRVRLTAYLAGIGSVLAIHVTTPYLNHPLGIGLLLIASVSFLREDHPEDHPRTNA